MEEVMEFKTMNELITKVGIELLGQLKTIFEIQNLNTNSITNKNTNITTCKRQCGGGKTMFKI